VRLTYIANARIPTEKAHGLQVMTMCDALAQAGAKVVLIVPARFNPIDEDPFRYYGLGETFSIRYIACLDAIALIRPCTPRWLAQLLFLIQDASFALSSRRFRDNGALLYTRDPAVALVHPSAVYEAHAQPQKALRLYRWICRRCRRLVSISRGLRDELVQSCNVPASRILIAPDAVDLDKFDIPLSKQEARRQVGLPTDKRIVLYAGHLYPWKGADVLAQAARVIEDPSYLFVFVGGTEADVETFSRRYAARQILVVGWQPHERIPTYLKAADVLVLPNSGKTRISSHHTSPLKLFEYMAARRPIVASDLPALREILDSGCALQVPPDQPLALAQGIEHLAQDPQLSQALSREAFQRAQHHTWRDRARRILEFLV